MEAICRFVSVIAADADAAVDATKQQNHEGDTNVKRFDKFPIDFSWWNHCTFNLIISVAFRSLRYTPDWQIEAQTANSFISSDFAELH